MGGGINRIRERLMRWNSEANNRQMPWKGEKNPYKIWLSEIILQQTRVEQGLPYYLRFVEKYPTIADLAAANDDDVMRLWQGLGYYSRARNLLNAARVVVSSYNGVFPTAYKEAIKLKGVGAYTAAAIASFSAGEAVAVVDGNVIRVLSRLLGVETPFDTAEGKKQFTFLANNLLDKTQPAQFNQAIMDFGATVCSPVPKCEKCDLIDSCFAYKNNMQSALPVRSKKLNRKTRHFTYFLIHNDDEILLRKREAKDIWQHLYELPMIEPGVSNHSLDDFLRHFTIIEESEVYTQKLTHQDVYSKFFELSAEKILNHSILSACISVKKQDLKKFGFSKNIYLYLHQKCLF
jgi:A/G-specific adenine glycosylase